MATARGLLVDIDTTPYYHCIARCVRRAFLCGDDRYSGRNFDHRKEWLVERLKFLAGIFAIDICAYAVMSNHFHLVLHVDRARAESWSDDEVIKRYRQLFAKCVEEPEMMAKKERSAIVAHWRERLWNLSWMMRSLNEYIARRANREDECRGRFWEGRFKSQALLDEGALLTCMSYVDLNPVRAGMAQSLEGSEFTSIQRRLKAAATVRGKNAQPKTPKGLAPLVGERGASSEATRLPISLVDYAQLVEWTGRALRDDGKRGKITGPPPKLLVNAGLATDVWLDTVRGFGRYFYHAAGDNENLRRDAARRGQKWARGVRHAPVMYAA